jgi:small subunit ribosomal protein S18
MSDRGKIRARRVSGNCAQHQRDVAVAIKTARELALLPYTQRTVSERAGGRRGGPPRERRAEVEDVDVAVAAADVAVEDEVDDVEVESEAAAEEGEE